MEKKRNTNIEILRIIAMFLIIWHHSGYINPQALGNDINYRNTVIKMSYFLGKIGVNIFFLITGYFQCKGKFKRKKLISTIATVEFYGFIVILISLLNENIEKTSSLMFYFPIISSMYWFATDYIIIYLLSPYLNKFIKVLEKKEFRKLLGICLIIWCIIPNIFGIIEGKIGQIFELNQLWWGILMYFIGAYIRMYNEPIFLKQKNNIIITVISFVLMIGEIALLSIICQNTEIFMLGSANQYINNVNNILILISAIAIFNLFINLKPWYNGYINLIASAMFGVYLLHSNNVTDYIEDYIVKIAYKLLETPTPLLYTISTTFNILIICTLIELTRIGLLKGIKKINSKILPHKT